MAGNSESVKRSEQTKKERYGTNFHARAGASGGKSRTRGYFGKLKDEGNTDELKRLSNAAIERSLARTAEEKSAAAKKGWETRKQLKEETESKPARRANKSVRLSRGAI